MSEELLIRHCSPTLAGIKTGNLFACRFPGKAEMRECVRCWNNLLTKKGLRVLPLRFRNGRALIYLYRPARLSDDLRHGTAERILKERGYCTDTSEKCVVQLIRRLCEYEEFPHEIGLFLGYPPEDVRGFIENCAEHCKLCGYRKVYGDVDRAAELFVRCKQCTESFCEWIHAGLAIGQPVAAMKSS